MGKRIVFIGDSITESGRFEDPEGIGTGYVRMIAKELDPRHMIMNKGVGGNRITDLADRWEEDVLRESPDVVSISIGINDVWRQLDSPEMEQVSPDDFKTIYRKLLTETRERTSTVIVLMEPTIIEEEADSKGNLMLLDYVKAIREMGEEYDAFVVPVHEVFINHLLHERPSKLTVDGVHMNKAGNELMAETWLESAGALL
ncbi:SGNH/GDSL hydrolase family protein [Halobacillus salinarum]|uniref:SGNH/GDSL hydrolase family protein n=1 Tax=Halobacillus salinarum TaxID=2932257 RepID=A0ABY4EPG8_9BACI|nr:SGNH/GDSL hydrolase family protein [Halobacillus salinarum]UOQ43991.1 SGNH/GDSL hydrolase family protein [Halobacillus salinarum]